MANTLLSLNSQLTEHSHASTSDDDNKSSKQAPSKKKNSECTTYEIIRLI